MAQSFKLFIKLLTIDNYRNPVMFCKTFMGQYPCSLIILQCRVVSMHYATKLFYFINKKIKCNYIFDQIKYRHVLYQVVLHISGGVFSHSVALFTDVAHLASDLISFLISLLALYLSTKPASKRMSMGYYRIGRSNVCVPWNKLKVLLNCH